MCPKCSLAAHSYLKYRHHRHFTTGEGTKKDLSGEGKGPSMQSNNRITHQERGNMELMTLSGHMDDRQDGLGDHFLSVEQADHLYSQVKTLSVFSSEKTNDYPVLSSYALKGTRGTSDTRNTTNTTDNLALPDERHYRCNRKDARS